MKIKPFKTFVNAAGISPYRKLETPQYWQPTCWLKKAALVRLYWLLASITITYRYTIRSQQEVEIQNSYQLKCSEYNLQKRIDGTEKFDATHCQNEWTQTYISFPIGQVFTKNTKNVDAFSPQMQLSRTQTNDLFGLSFQFQETDLDAEIFSLHTLYSSQQKNQKIIDQRNVPFMDSQITFFLSTGRDDIHGQIHQIEITPQFFSVEQPS